MVSFIGKRAGKGEPDLIGEPDGIVQGSFPAFLLICQFRSSGFIPLFFCLQERYGPGGLRLFCRTPAFLDHFSLFLEKDCDRSGERLISIRLRKVFEFDEKAVLDHSDNGRTVLSYAARNGRSVRIPVKKSQVKEVGAHPRKEQDEKAHSDDHP
jgi:hypothetical protein